MTTSLDSPADHPVARPSRPPARFVPETASGPPSHRGTRSGNGVQVDLAQVFGPLASLVADDDVTDVFVNGGGGTWVDRGDGPSPHAGVHLSEASARALAVRLVAVGGRHVDESTPCVDVRLAGGIRVHVVLPPVSTTGTLVSIRLPRAEPLSLDDLERGGLLDDIGDVGLRRLVAERRNVLVTGAGGSGKTTLLGALLSESDPDDRIVTVEDVAELRPVHPHVVSLETRQANLEGVGEIGLPRLVREALRMRPDRLVVGECRGVEIRDLLGALNTGHDGGAGTLHANGLVDVPARLEALGALAGLSPAALARQAVSAIDAVLHVDRRHGRRRLAQVGTLVIGADGRLEARVAHAA